MKKNKKFDLDFFSRYNSLSPAEEKLLLLILKSRIKISDIESIKGQNHLMIFLKKYVKEVNRLNNYNISSKKLLMINSNEIDVLNYLELNKIPVKKLIKILSKINVKKIEIKPDTEKIKRIVDKKLKIKRFIYLVFLLLDISVIAYAGYKLYNWQDGNVKLSKIDEHINEISKEKEVTQDDNTIAIDQDQYKKYFSVPMVDVDFNSLEKENSDTVAWIKVNGTTINYPVVQTTDNDYYLEHSFNKKQSKKGWVFMDYRNNASEFDQNTIIYAHGLLNNVMFGELKNVVKDSWYKNSDNHIVKLATKKELSLWKVFSTYKIDPEDYYITTNFSSDNDYLKFIDTLKQRSVYDYETNVSTSDKIITLSTCYTHGVRVVLHAKLISVNKK